MTKWFYHLNNIVKGPVSPLELENLISTLDHPEKTLVWSRGHTDWISADRWQPDLIIEEKKYSHSTADSSQTIEHNNKPEKPDFSVSKTFMSSEDTFGGINPSDSVYQILPVEHTYIPEDEKFKVQLNFIDQPMMTKVELMAFAARTDDPSLIAIFDRKSQDWKEIYAFKDIVDKLGLTRRKHPRVPILAQFNGTTSRHEKFSARLVTISIGGLGLTDVFDLNIGDMIYGNITSPHFYSPVAIESEVTYCGNDGYVGLKFTQINDDSMSLVTDYVKRFSQNI